MEDAFGAALLDERDRLLERFLSLLHIIFLYGYSHLFDGRFHQGFDVKISKLSLLVLFGPFDGRWMTCQIRFSFLYPSLSPPSFHHSEKSRKAKDN